MPVTPQYEWSQTIDHIDVRVKLPGITRQKPDIFVTEVLVKVVAHPYVLVLDLHAAVDTDSGSAYATPGEIVFNLPKVWVQFPFCVLQAGEVGPSSSQDLDL